MTKKRLSEGGDAIVLADAARAERYLLTRRNQLPGICIFAIVVLLSAYEVFVGFGLTSP